MGWVMKNIIINPNGGTIVPPVPNGENGKYTLRQLQHIVGGYIQIVKAKDGRVAVINEEAKILTGFPGEEGLPENPTATEMIELFPGDKVVGPVLFCAKEDID